MENFHENGMEVFLPSTHVTTELTENLRCNTSYTAGHSRNILNLNILPLVSNSTQQLQRL